MQSMGCFFCSPGHFSVPGNWVLHVSCRRTNQPRIGCRSSEAGRFRKVKANASSCWWLEALGVDLYNKPTFSVNIFHEWKAVWLNSNRQDPPEMTPEANSSLRAMGAQTSPPQGMPGTRYGELPPSDPSGSTSLAEGAHAVCCIEPSPEHSSHGRGTEEALPATPLCGPAPPRPTQAPSGPGAASSAAPPSSASTVGVIPSQLPAP